MATKKEKSEKRLYIELGRRWDEFKRDDNASSLEKILAIDDSIPQTDESRSALASSKIKAKYLLARHYLSGDKKKGDKQQDNDCNQALSYLEQIADVPDSKNEVRELRARVYFSLKEFRKAVPLFEECYLDETDEQRKKEFGLLLATTIIETNNMPSETRKKWITSNKIPEVNMDVAIYYTSHDNSSINLTIPCHYMMKALDVLDSIKATLPDQEFVKRKKEIIRNYRLVVFNIVDYYTKLISSCTGVKDDKTQKEHESLGRFVQKHLEKLLNFKRINIDEYNPINHQSQVMDIRDVCFNVGCLKQNNLLYISREYFIEANVEDTTAWLRYANFLYITGKYAETKDACKILAKIDGVPQNVKHKAQFIDVVASYMMDIDVDNSFLNELEQALPINSVEWSFVRGMLAINYINSDEHSKAKKLVRETPFFMQTEEPVRVEYQLLKRALKANSCL